MKKIVALLLVGVLVIGLCACGKTENTPAAQTQSGAPKGLQIGYAKVDITAPIGSPMGGYGNESNRLATSLLDYQYITVVAATGENGETVLLCGVDNMNMPGHAATPAKEAMSKATGVPVENIHLAASHSHSTASLSGDYKQEFIKLAEKAAVEAMADRTTATIEVASGTAENMTWVRHYVRADGTKCGPNFGSSSTATVVGHVSEADCEFRVVRFAREGGKKPVVMLNWQSHPTFTGGITTYDLSADFVGVIREYVETNTDCLASYYNGAAGNLTPSSWVEGETVTSDYREYGKIVGEKIVAAMENMTPVGGADVKNTATTVVGECDHTEDGLVPEAQKIQEMFATTGNNREACLAYGLPLGIEGIYHANGIVARAARGLTEDVPVWAASIGGVGFAIAPYEMTDSNGVDIREASPFEMTFIVGYCNDYYNYIISDSAYDYTNYEFQTRRYARGIGEDLADAFVGMLEELHG